MIKVKAIHKLGESEHVYDIYMTFYQNPIITISIEGMMTPPKMSPTLSSSHSSYADSYEFLENWIVISVSKISPFHGSTGIKGYTGSTGTTGYSSISIPITIMKSGKKPVSEYSGSVGVTGSPCPSGMPGVSGMPGSPTGYNDYENEVISILLGSIRDNKIQTLLEEK